MREVWNGIGIRISLILNYACDIDACIFYSYKCDIWRDSYIYIYVIICMLLIYNISYIFIRIFCVHVICKYNLIFNSRRSCWHIYSSVTYQRHVHSEIHLPSLSTYHSFVLYKRLHQVTRNVQISPRFVSLPAFPVPWKSARTV